MQKVYGFFDEQNGFFYNFILRCFFSNEHMGVQVNWFLENDDTYLEKICYNSCDESCDNILTYGDGKKENSFESNTV